MKNGGVILFSIIFLLIATPIAYADNFLTGYSIFDKAGDFFSNSVNFFKSLFSRDKVAGLGDISSAKDDNLIVTCQNNAVRCNIGNECAGSPCIMKCQNNQWVENEYCQEECSNGQCIITEECGNNEREGDEECDGDDLDEETCRTKGFSSGDLSCNEDCTFNIDNCIANQENLESTVAIPGDNDPVIEDYSIDITKNPQEGVLCLNHPISKDIT